MFPKATLVDVVLAAHRTRMVGRPSLRGDAGCIRILVGVLHVFHQCLAAEEEFVADRAAGCVRAADQGGVLMTDLRRMGTEAGLRGEALAADVAMERSVLRPLHLGIVISKMLLKVR